MANQDPIRVMLADDAVEIRESIAELVRSDPTLELVGIARDADEAIALALQARPEVALLDVKMPGGGGPRAVREIRQGSPGTRMVALSAYEDRSSVLEMLRAGASGYVVKGAGGQVLETIHRTARGQTTLSEQVAHHVVAELSAKLEREGRERAERQEAMRQVRRAISGGALRMVFQPIVQLDSRQVWGMEALARFDLEPHRTPDRWFADADTMGLRDEMEVAAVRLALEALPLIDEGTCLSVNVSPRTVISRALEDFIDSERGPRVVFEITEHVHIPDYEALNTSLGVFRSRGVRVAIDDAGAGFASLRHILQVAPDVIKLDLSLTQNIHADPARRSLTKSLIAFAEEIGAMAVAEGIETQEQLDTLQSLGASHGQGYFLGRPGELRPVGDLDGFGAVAP